MLLINLGMEAAAIYHGMRIAQMVFSPVLKATFQLTDRLNNTSRGDGGFGSTGLYHRATHQDSGVIMILTDQEVERYARQVVMPEIGELGQKRLLDAKVLF